VEWRVLSVRPGLTLDVTKRIEFALDIARGMACLHAQRPIIIHRDLKTANLLVSARFEIKVADFGLSRIKDASHVSRALRMLFLTCALADINRPCAGWCLMACACGLSVFRACCGSCSLSCDRFAHQHSMQLKIG
jgi:serine/threonine protein kinase